MTAAFICTDGTPWDYGAIAPGTVILHPSARQVGEQNRQMSGDLHCSVCGKPAMGFASSNLGPISFAFCAACARKPAEPESMFCYLFEEVSDNGDGLRKEMDSFYTFINGEYVSWPDYVDRRRAEVKL